MDKFHQNTHVVCPICCNNSDFSLEINGFDIFKCQRCGHGFVSPSPSVEQLKAIYDTEKSDISNSDSFQLLEAYRKDPPEVHFYYKKQLDCCLDILRKTGTQNPKILDLGCSCGVFLRCLKDQGFANIQGIDINPKAADLGKRVLDVPISTTALEELESSQKFDLIIAFAIFEHAIDPMALLGNLQKHLEKGGVIIFLVPNFNGFIKNLMGKNWLWYIPPFHLHYFTPESIKKMVLSKGFLISELRTDNWGTYLYLLVTLLLGARVMQGGTGKMTLSYRTILRMDQILRFFLFPITFIGKLFHKEPHIVGILKNENG